MPCEVVKNSFNGRLKIRDGSATPLSKTADFEDGDFEFAETDPSEPVIVRGVVRDLTKGTEEMSTWSFTAKLTDKLLRRTIKKFVYDAQTETISGLTPNALNSDNATAYSYEQGSLAPQSGETGMPTKLPNGATPAANGEYAEPVGTADEESIVAVVDFDIFTNAGDSDVNITYDAIGVTTLKSDGCAPARKTFQLILEELNAARDTVIESYALQNARVVSITQSERDDANRVRFEGVALDTEVTIVDGAVS